MDEGPVPAKAAFSTPIHESLELGRKLPRRLRRTNGCNRIQPLKAARLLPTPLSLSPSARPAGLIASSLGRLRAQCQRPVPDPSLLTTQQLREGLSDLEKLIGVQLNAMNEATHLRLERLQNVPGEIDARIEHLRDLTRERFDREDEKVERLESLHNALFAGIALQFHERDTRTDQTAATSKQALDAALLAAKELVGQQNEANAAAATKAELSTIKQIDQIVVLIGTIEKALGAQIIEIKERIDRNEGGIAMGAAGDTTRRADSTLSLAVLSVVISVLSIITFIVVAVVTRR